MGFDPLDPSILSSYRPSQRPFSEQFCDNANSILIKVEFLTAEQKQGTLIKGWYEMPVHTCIM